MDSATVVDASSPVPDMGAEGTDASIPPPRNEPEGFETLTDRPFAAADEMGWNDQDEDPDWTLVEDPMAPTSSPSVLQIRYPAGFRAGGSPARCFYESAFSAQRRREIYVAFSMWHSNNWEGHRSGVNKVVFIGDTSGGNGGGGQLYVNAAGSGDSNLRFMVMMQPVGNARRLPANVGPEGANSLPKEEWAQVELVLRAGDPGMPNGEVHGWINGVKTHEYTDVVMFEDDANGFFNRIVLGATWGGTDQTVQNDMFRRFDHFYMSGRGAPE